MTTKNAKLQRLTVYMIALENHLGVEMEVLETPDYDKPSVNVELVVRSTTGVIIGETSVVLKDTAKDDVLFGVRVGLFSIYGASFMTDEVTRLLQK